MPDSGKTGKPEESGTRADSVAIVAESDQSPSFARCPTCPGLGRTPTLHVGCTPIQGGKDTDAEIDNKLMASLSPPEPAQHKGQSLQRCSYPLCKFQRQLSSGGSEEGGPVVVDREIVDGPPDQGTAQVVFAASSSPGPSTPVLKGKRKAEADAEEGPVTPPKKNQKPAISEADEVVNDKTDSEQYWEHHVPTIFGDLQDQPETSYGRGVCRQIQLETLSPSNLDVADDPMGIPMGDVVELESTSTFVTLFIAGFGFDTANHEGGRMLTSFTDELHESDPEGVGLEGLNILQELSGANADEPSSMDDQLDQHF